MPKVYDKCPNCNAKIREEKGIFKGKNKIISSENYHIIKDFIDDDDFIEEAYCDSCAYVVKLFDSERSLLRYYRKYFNDHPKKKLKKDLILKVNELRKDIDSRKVRIIKSFINNVNLYSNNEKDFQSVSLVESFIIVDSGMWSTSSDNLDAMWSAVHDAAARDGADSSKKISTGLNQVKDLIKMEAVDKGCNSVIDLKFNFSELAGNGKILIFCQGTAAINKKNIVPDFSSLNKELSEIEEYQKGIDDINHFLTYKSDDALVDLLKTIKP